MDKELKNELTTKFNLSGVVIDLLEKRGYDTEEKITDFLFPSDSDFFDPFKLRNMDKLVARIKKAIEKNEKVLIFGDYDVDGVSASAMLLVGLELLIKI